jgi:hypothetical protein
MCTEHREHVRRSLLRASCGLLASVVVVTTLMPSADARTRNGKCERVAAATRSGAELHVIADAEEVAIGGVVDPQHLATVRQWVRDLRASGRTVCALYRKGRAVGQRDTHVDDLFDVVMNMRIDESLRLLWGGGGVTAVGWLYEESFDDLRATSDSLGPLDSGGVGRLDSLPAPVLLTVGFVTVTASKVVQYEQFHPQVGPITLETSATVWLEACPGGWRGETPTDASWGPQWPPGTCVAFRNGTPAKLPNAWRSDMHLSVAIRAKAATAKNVDIWLRYTAVDLASQCFVGGVEAHCEPLTQPNRA